MNIICKISIDDCTCCKACPLLCWHESSISIKVLDGANLGVAKRRRGAEPRRYSIIRYLVATTDRDVIPVDVIQLDSAALLECSRVHISIEMDW